MATSSEHSDIEANVKRAHSLMDQGDYQSALDIFAEVGESMGTR